MRRTDTTIGETVRINRPGDGEHGREGVLVQLLPVGEEHPACVRFAGDLTDFNGWYDLTELEQP